MNVDVVELILHKELGNNLRVLGRQIDVELDDSALKGTENRAYDVEFESLVSSQVLIREPVDASQLLLV